MKGFKKMLSSWYKKSKDRIWWEDVSDTVGLLIFSFDKEKEYNMFSDYPHKLSEEEKNIFEEENPYWAEFFSNR